MAYIICSACPSGAMMKYEKNFYLAIVRAHNARANNYWHSITDSYVAGKCTPRSGSPIVAVIKVGEDESAEDLFHAFRMDAYRRMREGDAGFTMTSTPKLGSV